MKADGAPCRLVTLGVSGHIISQGMYRVAIPPCPLSLALSFMIDAPLEKHIFFRTTSFMGVKATLQGLSPLQLGIALAGLTLIGLIVSSLYNALTSPLKGVPGPWMSLFSDRQLKSAVTGGRRIFYIDALHRKYGPVVRISPQEVAVFDTEAFRQIHAVSGGYTKGDFYTKLTNFPVHSVFTLRDAKEHGVRRRLFAKGFSKTYLREHWEGVVRDKVQFAVNRLVGDAEAHSGKVDVFKWWSLMGADIIGCLCFGESFGLLDLGDVSIVLMTSDSQANNNSVPNMSRYLSLP